MAVSVVGIFLYCTSKILPSLALAFPDFITFFCHHIAHIDYQLFNLKKWVTLGDANIKTTTFVPCSYAKRRIGQAAQLLANQKAWHFQGGEELRYRKGRRQNSNSVL